MFKAKVTIKTTDGTSTYNFSFDYINRRYVKVALDNTNLRYDEDYTVEGHTVSLVNPTKDNQELVITRETPTDAQVSWSDSSIMRSKDLNLFNTQILHINEELLDYISYATLQGMQEWDGLNKELTNLSDPTQPSSAVTKQYLENKQAEFNKYLTKYQTNILSLVDAVEKASVSASKDREETQKILQQMRTNLGFNIVDYKLKAEADTEIQGLSTRIQQLQTLFISTLQQLQTLINTNLTRLQENIETKLTKTTEHIESINNSLTEFMESPINAHTLQGLDVASLADNLVGLKDMTIEPIIDWDRTIQEQGGTDKRWFTNNNTDKIFKTANYQLFCKTYWTDYDYLFIPFVYGTDYKWTWSNIYPVELLKFSLQNLKRILFIGNSTAWFTVYPLNNSTVASGIDSSKSSTLESFYIENIQQPIREIYGIKVNRKENA